MALNACTWTPRDKGPAPRRALPRNIPIRLRSRQASSQAGSYRYRPPAHPSSPPRSPTEKIQWDHLARSLKPPQEQETRAYDNLIIRYRDAGNTEPVTVTGPLTLTDGEYHLHVRLLEA